jgi:hypothetical protein
MSHTRGSFGAALVGSALLVMGCDTPTPPAPTFEAVVPGAPAFQGAVRDPGQPVVSLTDFSVVGTSSLVRTPNGVNYSLSTTGLSPGHAYTLWIVIFNATEGCAHPIPGVSSCGDFDVVNDDAQPDMMFAGGNVAGGSGHATFSGRRRVGDSSGSANGPVALPAHGLTDPWGAEIHLVVHDHGPVLPGYMPDMIQTIDGGCTDAGVPAAGVPSPWNDYDGDPGVGAFGRRGPNSCASIQASIHRP